MIGLQRPPCTLCRQPRVGYALLDGRPLEICMGCAARLLSAEVVYPKGTARVPGRPAPRPQRTGRA